MDITGIDVVAKVLIVLKLLIEQFVLLKVLTSIRFTMAVVRRLKAIVVSLENGWFIIRLSSKAVSRLCGLSTVKLPRSPVMVRLGALAGWNLDLATILDHCSR